MKSIQGRYGRIKSISPFLFSLALSGLLFSTCHAEELYVSQLLREAERQQLHQDRYWRTLLHYKPSLSGQRSLVDDPNFFASPLGKSNPEEELKATLKSLFQEGEGRKHPVCRFAARYDWLKEKLKIDPARLPVPECLPFQRLVRNMRPSAVALVFPTAHMNSPASMFGHTLLTIDTDSGIKLLSQAVNYAAVTTDTADPFFALKGLLGFYKGYFSVLPYYAKIQEYSDIDRRDIWEYNLNLDKAEVRRLLMHAYEMDFIYSDYYFLDENCSYNILFLLEAARPSVNLTDRLPPWVIPLDTIRAVKASGLLKDIQYRPSRVAKIAHIADLLPDEGRRLAGSVSRGEVAPQDISGRAVDRIEKIRILDLASEYHQYRYTKRELSREVYSGRMVGILKARSNLGSADSEGYQFPVPDRPEEGHLSDKLGIGAGVKKGYGFQEIRWRPAYHELLDPGKGYTEGAHIGFMNTALRYYPPLNSVRLERLDIIDIISLAPRDDLFSPISWKITAGVFRRDLSNEDDAAVFRVNPAAGTVYRIKPLGLWYFMLETDLNIGSLPDHSWSAGIGGSSGLIKNLTKRWKTHIYFKDIYYGLGFRQNAAEAAVLQAYTLTTNMSLQLDLLKRFSPDYDYYEAKVSWNVFF